mmetsp:Transcript_100317/g.281850  ORF Transcript_100317/g.281850 Transcript_100317/m.281850 type:complete len:384 (-) Transcript_100317:139-1290(-)
MHSLLIGGPKFGHKCWFSFVRLVWYVWRTGFFAFEFSGINLSELFVLTCDMGMHIVRIYQLWYHTSHLYLEKYPTGQPPLFAAPADAPAVEARSVAACLTASAGTMLESKVGICLQAQCFAGCLTASVGTMMESKAGICLQAACVCSAAQMYYGACVSTMVQGSLLSLCGSYPALLFMEALRARMLKVPFWRKLIVDLIGQEHLEALEEHAMVREPPSSAPSKAAVLKGSANSRMRPGSSRAVREKDLEESDLPECVLCLDSIATSRMSQCKHFVACGGCGPLLHGATSCPMCRTPGTLVQDVRSRSDMCTCCQDRAACWVMSNCEHWVACRNCRCRLVYHELRRRKVAGVPSSAQRVPTELLVSTELPCPLCRVEGSLVKCM